MSKKQSTRRRKARKPKLISVEGHQLTEAMHADYERCLEARVRPNITAADTLRLGLSDFLSVYKPSNKIKDQLLRITQEAAHTAIALGSMRDYAWYEKGVVRSAGCELVEKLALELYNASAKLTAIAMNVKAEETTKLQHWLAQDEQVARIGRLTEIAHAQ